jgi:hypothetical protein
MCRKNRGAVMGNYLETLRNTSGKQFKSVMRAADVLSGKHLERSVRGALASIGATSLANKIANCGRAAVCSSLYCRKCRSRAASKMEQRLQGRFRTALRSNPKLLQERWRYLTVLCEVTEFKVGNVKAAVTRARTVLRALKRKFPKLWMQGAFEFELVDLDDMQSTEDAEFSVKKRTLLAMLDGDEAKFVGKKILVHYHAVVDLGDCASGEIGDWFRKRYPSHSRQIELKETRSKQDVEDKLRKIASYGFKNRLRYNKSFITSGYETGSYFTNEDAGKLIKLYDQFIGSGTGSYKSVLIGL